MGIDFLLATETRSKVIDDLLLKLRENYVFGETTGGGAHPGDIYHLDSNFTVFIPTGRAINPITNTNWEGTGVSPDIEIPQEQALKVAQIQALKRVLESIGDTPSGARKMLMEEAQKALAELNGNAGAGVFFQPPV